jgi:hypothetical protein
MDTVSVEEVLATRAQERETFAEDKRPDAKDLSHHLSELSKRRRPSPLKELFQYIHPGILSFAGGMLLCLVVRMKAEFRDAESVVFSLGEVQCGGPGCCGFHVA